jgi:formylglycine-generating enzyme required for sulfatase activity
MAKYFTICFLFITSISFGNNLQISPVTLSTSGSSSYLNFSISWEKSWRVSSNPNNRDAVWIYVKRGDCASPQWQHVNLSDIDNDHSAGSPLFVDAYADKKGVMVYRSSDGLGDITNVNIQLKLDAPPAGNYQYKVFGIEMVYINPGAFYLGDAVSTYTFRTGSSLNPYLLTSENAIKINSSNNDLWSNVYTTESFTLPPAFPKGYNAFYCMKYEISQGQYASFLNHIRQDAAQNRYDPINFNVGRYTISGSWPNLIATVPERACNWLSFTDVAAFLDWSALSPMTELEFEKACRGGNIPIAGEFAWGGNQIIDADSIVAGTDGLSNESIGTPIAIGTGLANFNSNGVLGPLRCGFAAKTSTTRFEAGATYYGVMEMSGNVIERCYNIDSSLYGRGYLFTGSHGDGELSITPNAGYANQNWPAEGFSQFTFEGNSVALRGGAWNSPNSNNGDLLKVSDRTANIFNTSIPQPDSKARGVGLGGRGVSRRQ